GSAGPDHLPIAGTSVPSEIPGPGGGAALLEPSSSVPAVVLPAGARTRDEVECSRSRRLRRGHRRRLRRVPLRHGTAGVLGAEAGERRRQEEAERRRGGGGGREVRAAVRRAALHRDPRHGAPLTDDRVPCRAVMCEL
ncbi:unnamed protein product, partial [Urochloa humidicola]